MRPFGENKVTVKEAWKRSMSVAAELKAKGAKKGDRAIILSMQDEGKLNRFASVLKSCARSF